jgi:ATP-binding cassette subfamily B protein
MADAGSPRWLLGLVRPHLGRLGAVLGMSAALSGVALAQPYLTKLIIDDGLLAGRIDRVGWLCAAMLASAVLGAGLAALNRWHYVTVSGRVLFALREMVFAHLQRLSPDFYARRPLGDVVSRLDGDVAELQRFAVDGLLAAVNAVLVLGGSLAVMLLLSPGLTLLAFVALPAQMVILALLRPVVECQTRRLREANGVLTGFLLDNLSRMKLVQACGAAERERARFSALNDGYLRDLRRAELTGQAGAAIPGLLGGIATALVFLVGGAMVVDGGMTVGTLVAFTAYLARAAGPVGTLLGLWLAQKRARVSLQRVRALLAEAPAVIEAARPSSPAAQGRGEIRFEDVSFAFDPAAPVLTGISVTMEAGGKVGVVGVSGAGKSTLVDLLHRHYDPQAGRILLDGIDLRELRLDELRRRIAVVGQDVQLVAGSLAENIRYAVPDASDSAVKEAAQLAQVWEFAEALPEGLDTQVGERGLALSGGQRQRVALARAILQDPLVLVLDEATAAVDEGRERLIGETLERLFAGRTRIVVSHRPVPLVGADQVLVLEGGRVEARRLESVA